MLCSNETIGQLAMTNSIGRYGHVLRREDGHFLRRALDCEVDGQRWREVEEDMEEAGWGGMYEGWLEMEICTLWIKMT